ncbi:hypothetical protein [Sorangium cellulosum]|uniref:Uncharacterized protein n=1 Tax=Sorangium cellulosum So0157-2 TaxID=1254432 RepID=S4Y826_SORCE|nr:hypothetical protein [Sorangium cellulosum]AGP41004.1 hypothetical protein SCE1572_44830 [Sorangium cellulosum So0157-2]
MTRLPSIRRSVVSWRAIPSATIAVDTQRPASSGSATLPAATESKRRASSSAAATSFCATRFTRCGSVGSDERSAA